MRTHRGAQRLSDPYDSLQRGPSQTPDAPQESWEAIKAQAWTAAEEHGQGNVPLEIRTRLRHQTRGMGDPSPNVKGLAVVYYFRVGNRIKIGTTTNLPERVTALRPEEVLATEPGGYELEKQRHKEFAEYHVAYEWFAQGPDLLKHIVRLRGGRA